MARTRYAYLLGITAPILEQISVNGTLRQRRENSVGYGVFFCCFGRCVI